MNARRSTVARTLIIVTMLLLLGGGASASAYFDQCANKDPLNSCDWIGGILNAENSRYFEGMSVPQRIIITGIAPTPGDMHTLTFRHETTKGGIHAYDFLVGWNQGNVPPLTLNPCSGLKGAVGTTCAALRSAAYSYDVVLPDDGYVSKDGTTMQRIQAFENAYGDRTIVIRGNSAITDASMTLVHNVAPGGDTGDSEVQYVLTWTSSSTVVMIELAGHLSVSGNAPIAWGPGLGASMISGGPYHFNLGTIDGASLGSQDNPIMGGSILGLPQVTCKDPTYPLPPGMQRDIAFEEVFNLDTSIIAEYTATSVAPPLLEVTADTALDRISARSLGFTGSVTATVELTRTATGDRFSCPVTFTYSPGMACLDPTYILLPGQTIDLSFSDVFDLAGEPIAGFSSTSTGPPTILVTTDTATDNISLQDQGFSGDDYVTVTITDIDTTMTCRLRVLSSLDDVACKYPSYVLRKGEQLRIPFSDVFDLGSFPLGAFTATTSAPPTVLLTADTADMINATSHGLEGEAVGYVTLAAQGQSKTCAINFTGIPSSCDTPECRACADYDCMVEHSCIDSTIFVLNPSVAVVLSQLMPVSRQYSISSFTALDSSYTISPAKGAVDQIFEIAAVTVPHNDITAARITIDIAGATNGPVLYCPALRRWHFTLGLPMTRPETDLLVTGSRAVSHYFEDTGTVKQAGPYIFTAKVWVR